MRSICRDMFRILLACLLVAGNAVADSNDPVHDECDGVGELEFLCGLGNAEDLVKLPGVDWIIAGGIGTRRGHEARAGLRLIDSRTGDWQHWIPNPGITSEFDPDQFPGCPGPPDASRFMAHGLAVRAMSDSRSRLYVVNHAERESIEVFEVDTSANVPGISWVGCLMSETSLPLNSVAVAPDGSVFATVFLMPGTTIQDVLAGRTTGQLLRWRVGASEAEAIPGTELSGNNGLEISASGDRLYVVAFGGKELVEFDTEGRRMRSADLGDYWPDNVRWDDQGRLVVAGMTTNDPACEDPEIPTSQNSDSACYKGYVIEAVDPETMDVSLLASGPTSKAFSHVSGALIDDGRAWVGTVGSDRLAIIELDTVVE
jgi:hypothetical protein